MKLPSPTFSKSRPPSSSPCGRLCYVGQLLRRLRQEYHRWPWPHRSSYPSQTFPSLRASLSSPSCHRSSDPRLASMRSHSVRAAGSSRGAFRDWQDGRGHPRSRGDWRLSGDMSRRCRREIRGIMTASEPLETQRGTVVHPTGCAFGPQEAEAKGEGGGAADGREAADRANRQLDHAQPSERFHLFSQTPTLDPGDRLLVVQDPNGSGRDGDRDWSGARRKSDGCQFAAPMRPPLMDCGTKR